MGAAAAVAHRGLAWLFILLAFVGWVLLLSGVASLQQSCYGSFETLARLVQAGGTLAPGAQNPLMGTVGYLAPVGCNKLFSYTWWIMAFEMFVLLVLALGATTAIATLRGAMVAMCAVLLVLLMNTANTFLYFNEVEGLTGAVPARARVLTAGAIISSIAFFCLIAILGWHNEDAGVSVPYDTEAGKRKPGPEPGGKKKGGLLGGLLGGRAVGDKESQRREEEGAGTVGSPRIAHVAAPPLVPAPERAASPRAPAAGTPVSTTTTAVFMPGAAPAAHGPVSYTVAPTVPVSSPAVPVSTGAGPVSPAR